MATTDAGSATLGRPPLTEPPLSPAARAEVIRFAQTGVPDCVLASAVGIKPTTWTMWKGRSEPGFVDFFEEIERARARGDLALIATVRRSAAEGDWKAAKYILSCRHAELSERRAALKAAAEEEAERARLAAAEQKAGDEFSDFSEEEWAHAARMIIERRRSAARQKAPETEAINRAFDAVHEDE